MEGGIIGKTAQFSTRSDHHTARPGHAHAVTIMILRVERFASRQCKGGKCQHACLKHRINCQPSPGWHGGGPIRPASHSGLTPTRRLVSTYLNAHWLLLRLLVSEQCVACNGEQTQKQNADHLYIPLSVMIGVVPVLLQPGEGLTLCSTAYLEYNNTYSKNQESTA